jgi:hypothetical protein
MKMKKRVVVRLTGGLGNQLHQYAYGFLLANKIKAQLLIDKEFLVKYSKNLNITLRDMEINKFDLDFEYYRSILSNHQILRLVKKIQLISDFLELIKIKVITRYQRLDSLILGNNNLIYLDGIIGEYLDYKSNLELIKRSIQVAPCFSNLMKIVNNEIIGSNTVSIHVRRSDYLKEGSIHHVLDLSYYHKAMEYFELKTKDPIFYVFSDDREFVKESFRGKNIKMINYIGEHSDFFDFLAIKKCRYHILANSTFSWWAAFLESSENRITIAPSVFLKNKKLDLKSTYPEDWIIF